MFIRLSSAIAILAASLLLGPFSAAADPPDPEEERVLAAGRADQSISIDGILDEAGWMAAATASEFLQYEPVEGAMPSQRTEVRVLFGTDAIYVGATMFDTNPNLIQATLGRRDSDSKADWFYVSLDSYLDRQTAYTFGVSAAGVQLDGITTREVNTTWDAVWESEVRMTPEGWVVEIRIPLSMLRFSEGGGTWGINFRRLIPRTNETLEWALVRRTDRSSGYVARYGRLEGLGSLVTRRGVQVLPYSVSRLDTSYPDDGPRSTSAGFDAGVDLKLGLSSNVTLDATINPDFGQVEADPAQLNLTAFETFFREKRPFFIEGAQILDFGLEHDGSLLYSRRIGASNPIIGASKLSGRTNGGFSFGVLGAATGDDFDPGRLYAVTRARQQLGLHSYVGGIVTAFGRSTPGERARAFVGAADWDIRFADNGFKVDGFFAVSDRGGQDVTDPERGFAAAANLDRVRGTFTYSAGARVYSDAFNPNDVGQLRRRNFMRFSVSSGYQVNGGQPFGPFQRGSLRLFGWNSRRYSDLIDQGVGLMMWSSATTAGYNDIEIRGSADHLFGGYDTYETRGLGPWAPPTSVSIRTSVESDSRRTWQVKPSGELEWAADGGMDVSLGLEGEWSAGSRLNLSAEISASSSNDRTAWASNEAFDRTDGGWLIGEFRSEPGELLPEEWAPLGSRTDLDDILGSVTPWDSDGRWFVPVFGKRDTRKVDLSMRANVTFTPRLSVQFFGQLFAARGQFHDFSILQDRDTLVPVGAFPKQFDFSIHSFQTNVVLRWEYRPGSAVFLVWSQARRDNRTLDPLDLQSRSPYNVRSGRQLGDTFGLLPANAFMIKLNYLFLR